jgi:hypothetical protein
MTLATTTTATATVTVTVTRRGRAVTVVRASRATARGVVVVARAGREPEDEVRRRVDAESLADGRVNRFVERERGEERAERAVVGFWQTFAERASEARRRHFDGRKTIDGKTSRK